MSEAEIGTLIAILVVNPAAGDEIEGTGGCRKLRVARPGGGKSGGYRTITFYSGESMPVFLLTVFAKNEKATLSKAEKNALKVLTARIVDEYRKRAE